MLKRFVTYIYLYDRGNRGPNVGFVKADIRDVGCRMELRLRGLDRFQGKGRVYLIVSDEKTVGIPAGEITIQQGMGHLKLAYARNLLGASGYSVTQIQAIVIRGGGSKLLISCWSEQVPESVLRGTFRIWEDTQSAAPPEKSDSSLSQTDNPEELPTVGIADAPTAPDETLIDFGVSPGSPDDARQTSPPENDSTKKIVISEQNQSSVSAADIATDNTLVPTEDEEIPVSATAHIATDNTLVPTENEEIPVSAAAHIATENTLVPAKDEEIPVSAAAHIATENTLDPTKDEEIPVSVTSETKADIIPDASLSVDTPALMATEIEADGAANAMANVIAPVSITTQEERNTIDANTPAAEQPVCTYQKIALTDIRAMLPKQNWYLCSNSFLIHGFFNYHYLILKTVVYNGQKKCYLGVPGIYEQPERTMAFMFGFPTFEPARARKEDTRASTEHASTPAAANETGIFGYWMLQLLD